MHAKSTKVRNFWRMQGAAKYFWGLGFKNVLKVTETFWDVVAKIF